MPQTENTHGTPFGKMSPEPSQATRATTSGQSSSRSATSAQGDSIQFLDLRSGAGPDASWETVTALPGAHWTLNSGESPKDVVDSSLYSILETGGVPEKYFLSARACQGIINRAERRGKKLPEELYTALCTQITRWTAESQKPTEPVKPLPTGWVQGGAIPR